MLPLSNKKEISIHAPAKGATTRVTDLFRVYRFQSTLPRRERLKHLLRYNFPTDFNPRSREGSDVKLVHVTDPTDISIHAPAKGATEYGVGGIACERNFNPRSREGSDG